VDEGDDDGDGILNRDEEIVVNGPPRMADEWSELSWKERLLWLAAFAITGGNEQAADMTAGTDMSGQNPANPYQTPQQNLEDLGDAADAALNAALDAAEKTLPKK
jgi:hypothetical protein